MLVLTRSRFPGGRPKWDGHIGKAVMYAGALLSVTVHSEIVDIIAHSWALVGDASGAGPCPDPGDRVICLPDDEAGQEASLGTVADSTGPDGPIDVIEVIEVEGMARCRRWAILLPAEAGAPRRDLTLGPGRVWEVSRSWQR